MTHFDEMLGAVEPYDLKFGNAVKHDYFYIPIFTYIQTNSDTLESEESILEYKTGTGRFETKAYASKVSAGIPLWQAIKDDLAKDFHYDIHDWQNDWFIITALKPFDSITDKNDQPRDRFLVRIRIAKQFDTTSLQPAGMECRWSDFKTLAAD